MWLNHSLGSSKTSQGAVRSTVLLPGSTAKLSPHQQGAGVLRSQDRIRSRAATGIRNGWVVTKQVCSNRTCTRASLEGDLEELGQGQNQSSSTQGRGTTAAQQQRSTCGDKVKPQLKTAPRRQEGTSVLLCVFPTALLSAAGLTLDIASYAPEGDLPRVLARRVHFSIPVYKYNFLHFLLVSLTDVNQNCISLVLIKIFTSL